ncbi:MAG: hypothetical protein IJF73_02020 [Clostridia bacterium]|nr:hypothetical protein [Clostridia bacterium]
MSSQLFVEVLPTKPGRRLPDVYAYLPAGRGYHVQYRFVYTYFPPRPELGYSDRRKNTDNADFYRLSEAYVGTLEGESFTPAFRALQSGEVSLALREDGAGDFVGGCHGDERAEAIAFLLDGSPLYLETPAFYACRELMLRQDTLINRCHTPDYPLCRHRQVYRLTGDTVNLSQYVEWVNDAHLVTSAFMPMMTVQRLDPENTDRRLTNTAEFFARVGGERVAVFDTTPYGPTPPEGLPTMVLEGTHAHAVRLSGRESGLTCECGITFPEGSPLSDRVRCRLWLRFARDLDSKAYFDIGGGTTPTAGTVWEGEVYYRITMKEVTHQ